MKLSKITAIVSLATFPATLYMSAQVPAMPTSPPPMPAGQEELSPERILELYGYVVGLQSGIRDFDLNEEEFASLLKGLKSSYAQEEMPKNLEQLFPQIQAFLGQRQAQIVEKRSAENREKAEKYFAELDGKKDVKKTDSGLYYEILKEGTGDKPTPTDTVKINYEGKLLDGTVFDSSYERSEPAEFPVSGVVPGFSEGLQLVKEGGKIKLHIPPDLGYGDQSPPTIPAGSVLVFEVELLEVKEGNPGQALEGFAPNPATP